MYTIHQYWFVNTSTGISFGPETSMQQQLRSTLRSSRSDLLYKPGSFRKLMLTVTMPQLYTGMSESFVSSSGNIPHLSYKMTNTLLKLGNRSILLRRSNMVAKAVLVGLNDKMVVGIMT